MSKRNTVNPGQYKAAGRLRPDETAAGRIAQRTGAGRKTRGRGVRIGSGRASGKRRWR